MHSLECIKVSLHMELAGIVVESGVISPIGCSSVKGVGMNVNFFERCGSLQRSMPRISEMPFLSSSPETNSAPSRDDAHVMATFMFSGTFCILGVCPVELARNPVGNSYE
jgi:hypothetical protein